MHVYCINLERRSDRRERAERECRRVGLGPVEFFRATDGRVESPPGLFISPSEYGCAASHCRIWRDVVEKKYPYALILEDDVEFLPEFNEKLKLVLQEAREIPDWDMIFIGYIFPVYKTRRTAHLIEAQPLGTHSYITTLECARKISVFDPKLMKVGIDFQLNRFPLKILCTSEPLTSQGDATSAHGLLSFKTLVDGDIGFERTIDYGFFARLAFQRAKSLIICVILYTCIR